MSHTSSVGLAGVSIQRRRAPSTARACAFPAVAASRDFTPMAVSQFDATTRVV
jgi:hypothetical protein